MLVAAAVMFCACDNLLDKDPQSKLSPETYFKTATDLQLFTNPYYNNLLPKNIYNEQSDQYVHQDPSDLVKSGTNRFVPDKGGGWDWGGTSGESTPVSTIFRNSVRILPWLPNTLL